MPRSHRRIDGSAVEYFAYDGLGSVRQMLDGSGSPLLAQTFDPYGNSFSRTGSGQTTHGFTGEQTDSNGLVFLRARYYNPSMGRFMQMDPSRQEKNLYVYALANPVNFTDPSGLIPPECIADPSGNLCKAAVLKPHIVSREQWGARDPVGEHVLWCDPQGYAECTVVTGEGFYDPETNPGGYACYTDLQPGKTLAEILDTVVLHHAGNTNNMTIQQVQNEHMDGEELMADIGYHFVIAKDGTIYEGRDVGARGYHVAGANTGKIGILVVGDFEPGDYLDTFLGEVKYSNEEADTPTNAQLNSLDALIRYLDAIYGIAWVQGHNDINNTRCPGDNLEPVVDRLDQRYGGGR